MVGAMPLWASELRSDPSCWPQWRRMETGLSAKCGAEDSTSAPLLCTGTHLIPHARCARISIPETLQTLTTSHSPLPLSPRSKQS
jgi:hypothetical protein